MFGFVRWHGMNVNMDEPWFKPAEMAFFAKARKVGLVTVFRSAKCVGCSAEIPKVDVAGGKLVKTHCSKKCYDDDTTRRKVGANDEG